MKALEILKANVEQAEMYLTSTTQHSDNFKKWVDIISTYNEAINELEELQNRSCESCAYYDNFNGVCFNSDSPLCADFVSGDFYCKYWESEDDN